MKKIFAGVLILLAALSLFAEEFITVYREGNDFFVLTLHTPAEIPAAGITLSNNAKHGYLVLKLD